ncbi:efflux RND transporter periplasmic adaptor subunit [Thauera sp. WH-2]|jgi:RND family efflux transporter MFP subunit|uniref:efflux RND transporter periplasmic adaptor subunit n=1 Tax=Thauera sp. WH-2 TaxID=3401574 RepID=UPI003AAB3117
MNTPSVLCAGLLSLSLAACGEPPAPAAVVEAARPALIVTVAETAAREAVRLSGRVRAARRAELSFDVPGFVDEFSLEEGRPVKAGEVVARLDERIYRSRLDAARAEFERAKNDLARYQRLWDSEQAVARAEVDDRRARLEAARTSLAAAERDLADTVIKAPFPGVITRRRIEPFTNVQAKQPIAELQDLNALEVVVNVPERLVRRMRPQQGAVAFLEGDRAVAGDAGAPRQALSLELKSFAAEADPLTQTYAVVLAVRSVPAGVNLLPGMAVSVEAADAEAEAAAAAATIRVPLAAVSADAQGQPGVWVVGQDGRVTRRPVHTGAIVGADMVVASGLASGERIVAAGVGALREGMAVRPLESR